MSHSHSHRPLAPARQAGLSLVELMVSITIGLMLLAGLTVLFSQQSAASRELEKVSRQIENGRYAAQVLREDLELAGYFGEYFDFAAPSAFPDPCSTSPADLDAASSMPVQGYDSPATVPTPLSACLSDADHVPGTDILVIRRAATATVAAATAVAGQLYMQTGLNASKTFGKIVDSGTDSSVFTLKKRDGSVAPLRDYLVHIYYVSPCNNPVAGATGCTDAADDGTPVPTLKRLELTVQAGTPAFSVVPLAEGIQNLQIDYGIDSDADGVPDTYTAGTYSTGTTPMTAADWGNTMAVRLNILARNLEQSAGHKDMKTYNLGAEGSVGPFEDGYKRRMFTEVVRLTNPSGRRAG